MMIPLAPDAQIADGRYRLVRELGRGGMGIVWEAEQVVSGKRVALKILTDKGATLRTRLLREARSVCRIEHPNVVSVLDVLTLGSDPALVMELLSGETLADVLKHGPLGSEDAESILLQVLRALSAAHASGVIHRDLKPDNIFVCGSGPLRGRTVKVLDFGIAKVVTKDAEDELRATRTGALLGTPEYMAPEQVYGEAGVDARADLWSFGIVFYECLAGFPPTRKENVGQTFKVITLLDLPELPPHVPPHLRKLIARCLEKDPSKRPASAEEIVAMLTGPHRAPRSRRTRVLGAAVILILSAFAAFVAASARPGPSPRVETFEHAPMAFEPTPIETPLETPKHAAVPRNEDPSAPVRHASSPRDSGTRARPATPVAPATSVRSRNELPPEDRVGPVVVKPPF